MWELLLLSTINVSSFNSLPFYPRNEFFELVRQGTTILHVTGSFIAIQSHNPGPRLPRIKKSFLSSWNPIFHILKKEIFVLLLLAFCTVLVELYFKTVIGQTFLEFPLKLPLRRNQKRPWIREGSGRREELERGGGASNVVHLFESLKVF